MKHFPSFCLIEELKHLDNEDLLIVENELRQSLTNVPSLQTARYLDIVRRELKRRNQAKVLQAERGVFDVFKF